MTGSFGDRVKAVLFKYSNEEKNLEKAIPYMNYKDDLQLAKFALKEVKDQYQIYLEGFDDIKKKNQILLLVCSLMITLPLSNNLIVKEIMTSKLLIIIFIVGIICLVIPIILLVISMKETQVRIPYFRDILNSMDKYKTANIIKSVIKTYANDLDINIKKREGKRIYIRYAESFILFGILFVFSALIWIIII